ncbi:MAG: peptidase [Alphaproteobacteria bacterium]|nr:peptidase [Alphaproteobacteria bacterium]
MTYCVGLRLAEGLVLLSDTRTNAGVDNISTFSKMHVVERPGERLACMMTAGNLSVSQMVVNMVQEGFHSETLDGSYSLATTPSMFATAQLVGEAIRKAFAAHGEAMRAQSIPFDVSILLAGQVKGRRMRLFQVYSAGNFIEATEETPFLQIGEHKYGKPILDRAARYDTPLYDAIKLVLVSMDSTLRSNLSVGLPIDLLVYRKDACRVDLRRRIHGDDPYFRQISEQWSSALREAYLAIPRPEWARNGH